MQNSLIREKIKAEILKYNKINVKSEYTNNIIERIYNNLGFKSKKIQVIFKKLNLSMEIIEKNYQVKLYGTKLFILNIIN